MNTKHHPLCGVALAALLLAPACTDDGGSMDSVTSLGVTTNMDETGSGSTAADDTAGTADSSGSDSADTGDSASSGDGDSDSSSATDTGSGGDTAASSTDTGSDSGLGETGDATMGNDSGLDTGFDTGLDTGLDTGFETGFMETGVTETGPYTETGDDPDCNGDGDGDGDTSGDGSLPDDPDCEAPSTYAECDADSDDPFQAMGLNCSDDATTTIPIANESFTATDGLSWKVARSYGVGLDCDMQPIWVPTEGDKFLIVSTGQLVEPDMDGNITLTESVTQPGADAQSNPDGQALPAPISAVNGSGGTPGMDCDGTNDCSDTLADQWNLGGGEANDLLYFSFELTVPQGVEGYTFDMAWFSAEFHEFVNTTYNDVFLVWAEGTNYTGNMSFVDNQPLTVTALAPYMTYEQNSPRLDGTGFEGVGGSTGWFQTRGVAVPGETLKLTFAIFDMGDSIYDTTAIIDNFRWECEGCDPSIPGDCGALPE